MSLCWFVCAVCASVAVRFLLHRLNCVVRDEQRRLPNTATGSVDPGKAAFGKSSSRCQHDWWQEGMDV